MQEGQFNHALTCALYIFLTAIHLDFCLPFDQTNYTVREEDGQVEVCIKLTSIGEYSQFVVPVGVNITLQDHSAVGKTLNVNNYRVLLAGISLCRR